MDLFIDAPEQGMRTIRRFIPRKLQPTLRGFRKRWQLRRLQLSEPFRSVYPYTQAAMIRATEPVSSCAGHRNKPHPRCHDSDQ